MSDLDYKNDKAIDPDNLHEENFRQPSIYDKYATHATEMEKSAKRAGEKVKTIRSQVLLAAKRNNPKLTAAELEATYRVDPDYIDAVEEKIEAEYEQSMAMNAVWTMGQKRHSLERANELFLGNYFAAPREPKKVKPGKRIAEIKDRSREAQASSQRTRAADKAETRQRTRRARK